MKKLLKKLFEFGIIKRNFVNSSYLFVQRTDSGKHEYNEVMYYQVLEVVK